MTLTPWTEWEDHTAGMYATEWAQEQVNDSSALLGDPDLFRETAREMIREWPVATQQNCAHMWSGRNAWIGQASCLYAHGAPAGATRAAWGTLTNEQQTVANEVARRVREEWERDRHAETLFVV